MKFLKLFILSVFIVVLLCGCNENKMTIDDNNDLFNDISSNIEKINELEKQISDLRLGIDTLNNDLNNKNDYKDDYNELKEKYNKISIENKDLKNKINNLNILVDNINKQNTSDIIYITFVAKGYIRISYTYGSANVLEGHIYNLAINKNYAIRDHFPSYFKNIGPSDNACSKKCWLKDINSTECINFEEFKTDSDIILYSSCLNEVSNENIEQQ